MACNLVGCIANYTCDNQLKLPVQGTNLAPFVHLWIQGSNFDITVGNDSDPDNGNMAVIKSFQLGTSNGAGMEVEIHDEQGGNFEAFMSRLNKSINNANFDYKMRVQWGWIDRACGATGGSIVSKSDVFIFIPIHVEASFAEGKIRYKLTGTSLLEVVFAAREATIQGSDDHKVSLKAAIRQLFLTGPPVINSVRFLRLSGEGSCGNADGTSQTSEWGFSEKDGGCDGPVQKWETDQQNKLSAAMKWIEPFSTDRDKGVVPIWNPSVPGGEIIFYEDPAPKCGESVDWCSRSLGTYLVNGGSCSNVLSFTPSAKWVFDAISKSGGKTGVTTGKSAPRTGRDGCNIGQKGAGNMTSTPFSTAQIDQNGFGSIEEYMAAQANHDSANKRVYSMEGELKIQGDPSIAGPLKVYGRTVSIVVISPFHIEQSGYCGDWLAKPGCHPVYSNKAWWVKGVDHMIKEGSYVTTLKVALMAPGSDIDEGSTFGGLNSGGWDGTS